MRPTTLGVVGLGAMGGSVALRAARAGVLRVVGYAPSPKDRAAAAHADRFTNAIVYVTPVEGGDRAAQEVADFWTRVMGAQPVTISAAQHDERLAWTSHLPQAVASALAAALATRGPSGAAYGQGALDTARLAGSSVEMWTDVLLMNRDQVLAALSGTQESLDELKTALKAGDGATVGRWLESGARWRSRFET